MFLKKIFYVFEVNEAVTVGVWRYSQIYGFGDCTSLEYVYFFVWGWGWDLKAHPGYVNGTSAASLRLIEPH